MPTSPSHSRHSGTHTERGGEERETERGGGRGGGERETEKEGGGHTMYMYIYTYMYMYIPPSPQDSAALYDLVFRLMKALHAGKVNTIYMYALMYSTHTHDAVLCCAISHILCP